MDELDDVEQINTRHREVRTQIIIGGNASPLHLHLKEFGDQRDTSTTTYTKRVSDGIDVLKWWALSDLDLPVPAFVLDFRSPIALHPPATAFVMPPFVTFCANQRGYVNHFIHVTGSELAENERDTSTQPRRRPNRHRHRHPYSNQR